VFKNDPILFCTKHIYYLIYFITIHITFIKIFVPSFLELDHFNKDRHKRHMNEHVLTSPIRSICVYCGSSPGSDAAFSHSASELGRLMAQSGIGLVYGGGVNGLMGTVARAVLDHGGTVTGIIPEFLIRKEAMMKDAQELIIVDDMHTRKRMMFEKADAFVALPGGIGTLEELVEQMTWVQLDRHIKPVLLANINQFWSPLLDLLAHMRQTEFIRATTEVRYLVADTTADILPLLHEAARRGQERGNLAAKLNPAL
jgi:uncharacterized protein (TIGR00730 family)